ncbi:MAG: hypothetical protein ABII82_03305 [Verrucomicrobiota bacterium]
MKMISSFSHLGFLVRFVACCLLGAALAGHAQTAPDASETPRFRTLGWGVRASDLHYSLGGKDVPVPVFDAGRSGFHRLPKTDAIRFYRLVENAEGKVERVTVAEVSLADSGPLPLLVFLPDPADAARYRIVPVADDLKAFPPRSCRFVNLTAVTINATVGDSAVVVPGGGEQVVDTHLGEGESSTRYTTVFVDIRDDKLMLAYNNWVFRPGQRTLVFIFLDKQGRPQVVRVVDGVNQLKPVGPT